MVVFKTTYTLRHPRLHISSMLKQAWNSCHLTLLCKEPLVAYRSARNTYTLLRSHNISRERQPEHNTTGSTRFNPDEDDDIVVIISDFDSE